MRSRRRAAVFERVEPRVMFTSVFSDLTTLTNANGQVSPQVAVDAAGDVFGTTAATSTSAGTVFEIPAGTTAPVTVASFGSPTGYNADGVNPTNVVIDAAGNLYGTSGPSVSTITTVDEPGTQDTLWRIAAGTSTVTPLAQFGTSTVGVPVDPALSLTIDAGGDLFYVLDQQYVDAIHPTAYRYSADGTTTTVFSGNGSAEYPHYQPQAPLAVDASGNVYAGFENLAQFGQYEIDKLPGDGTETLVGILPAATDTAALIGLAADPGGDLFVTAAGNAIDRVASGDKSLSLATTLNGTTDGDTFFGQPLADASGDLFAVTTSGGANGDGTLVELPAGAAAVVPVTSFAAVQTADPSLTVNSAGNLYGTTTTAAGVTVFELTNAAVIVAPTPTPTPTPTTLPEVTTAGLLPAVKASTVPAAAVAGTGRGVVRMTLTNTTATTDRGVNTVAVLLVPPGVTARAGAEQLHLYRRRLSLAAGAKTTMSVPVQVPASLSAGTYTLAFEATDAAGDLTRINGPTIAVAAPAVTVAATTAAAVVKTALTRGSFTITTTVTFGGNTTVAGRLAVDVQLTPDSGAALAIGTVVRRVVAKAGRSVIVRARTAAATGTFTPTVTATFTAANSALAPASVTATGAAVTFEPTSVPVAGLG